jgi:hypothetical protein
VATHIQPFSGLLDVNLAITAKRYNQDILNCVGFKNRHSLNQKIKKQYFMKSLITLLFLISSLTLLAQPNLQQIEALINDAHPGTCYFTKPLDSTVTQKVYFEIESNVWETIQTTTHQLLKEQKLEEKLQSDTSSSIDIIVSPLSKKLIRRPQHIRKPYLNSVKENSHFSNENAIFICLIEIPPRYITCSKTSILKDGKPIFIIKNEKVTIRKFVRRGNICFLSIEEVTQSDNKNIFEVYTGEWSNIYQETAHCPPNPRFSIEILRQKLIEKGYTIKNDGTLNTEFRNALIDFQRKNGLPEGRLNIETMKLLGFE